LNRRHKDFQSSALPTELPSQNHCYTDTKRTFAHCRLAACILLVFSLLRMKHSGAGYHVVQRLPRRKADKFNKVFDDGKERVRSLWERKGVVYAQLDANKGKQYKYPLHEATTVPQAVTEMQALKKLQRENVRAHRCRAGQLSASGAALALGVK
jgi:hypothetical protein